MKKACLSLIIMICFLQSFADHTKGGWIYYEYIGPGNQPSSDKYRITVYLFMTCHTLPQQISKQIFLSVYTGVNKDQFFKHIPVDFVSDPNIINCDTCDVCIIQKPELCYKYVTYETETELPISASGYTLGYQFCCRTAGIINIAGSAAVGDTWTINIPGTNNGSTAPENSSPFFQSNDTALICADNFFIFDFEALDADHDSLVYSFVQAYKGGVGQNPTYATPPFSSVPYSGGYSAGNPLGAGVTIDPISGRISGIAPSTIGEYVITVCVKEYRNGVYIGEARKSLHVYVAACNIVDAYILNDFNCGGFTKTFKNLVPSSTGATYQWDFGVPGITTDTSTNVNPVYTYPDTGTYKVSLIISLNKCIDSTYAFVKAYPTLAHDFTFSEPCSNSSIQFFDDLITATGIATGWSWNFGDTASGANNISSLQNPKHTFKNAGTYQVRFTVTNLLGCVSTVTRDITVMENPSISISGDTLICSADTLQLNIGTSGDITWTPPYNINDANIESPLVSPDVPTLYHVSVINVYGCKATDSVFVDVKPFVTIDAGRDTGICTGDLVRLNAISDALFLSWSPAASLNNPFIKDPVASPLVTTKYFVTGSIGKCLSTDSVTVKVAQLLIRVPIPDTSICLGSSVQLASGGGSIYSWSPAFFLNNAAIANPVATPNRDIIYIVTIRDTLGCIAQLYDTVLVQVKNILVDAGPRDTSVTINQPLQLNATGAQFYTWNPATGLNNPAIANPVANVSNDIEYVVAATGSGCIATDTIFVKTYKVLPGIYLPTAFTPNGDGLNDVFRPVVIGLKFIYYFKVFNRWGKLMYSNLNTRHTGWDGTYNEKPQAQDVYVWVAEGIDYLDKKIRQKGTVTLLR